MTLASHIHPLLVHFPIGLVLIGALFEAVSIGTGLERWHTVAVANVQAGAAFAVLTAITGWLLAKSMAMGGMPAVEWHRWLGTIAAVVALGAAIATAQAGRSTTVRRAYHVTLFGAAALIVITGHLGGLLVWGADFLRP
jgi:uncharacterized membrane protein